VFIRSVNDFDKQRRVEMIHYHRKLLSGIIVLIVLASLFSISPGRAAQPPHSLPEVIDTKAKYLFFFHNFYVEMNGPDKDCRYYELLRAFAENDLVVVSELRKDYVSPSEYAKEAATDIQKLLDAGVPAKNIAIGGHSKGGVIALQVSSLLRQPEIRYFILAGCGISSLAAEYPDPSLIRGRFLSLYADTDTIAGSCDVIMSPKRPGLTNREIVLNSPRGHRLFFHPMGYWLKPLYSYLK